MWLAKGRCACGGPVARRVAGPGACLATCNLCRRPIALVAWRPPRIALVLAAGLFATAILAAPLFEGSAPAWAAIEQELVLEREPSGYRYHVETTARDAEGGPVAVPRDEIPVWSFATSAALSHGTDLEWWTCEAPPACEFVLARDDIVYFTPLEPEAGLVRAYDPRKDLALVEVAGTWSRFANASEGLRVTITR